MHVNAWVVPGTPYLTPKIKYGVPGTIQLLQFTAKLSGTQGGLSADMRIASGCRHSPRGVSSERKN